jgi:predicted transglutaminase-like cysteine proteinase
MPLGAQALAPKAYVDFCQRRPSECGEDVAEVLVRARSATAERALLMGPPPQWAAAPPASLGAGTAAAETLRTRWTAQDLTPAPAPLLAVELPARIETQVELIDPAARADTAPNGPLAMTPGLWRTLNQVNGAVNRRLTAVADTATYGLDDYWTLPLQEDRRVGDCEDFVLEKQRALLAAGLPRAALNVAIVTTSWGETHAVLLVNTRAGELVLDNLSRSIVNWDETRYVWRQRTVEGDAFTWAMVRSPRPSDTPVLIASR